jgi:hypothetical protein
LRTPEWTPANSPGEKGVREKGVRNPFLLREGFHERGCQVKTLLLFEEGVVFSRIPHPGPRLINSTHWHARVWPEFFMGERARRR